MRSMHGMISRIAIGMISLAACPLVMAETVAFDVPYRDRTIRIEGELKKPPGDGPFPLVIGLHACDGPSNYSFNFWMSTLLAQGYATYLPDSFKPRGYLDVCAHTSWVTVSERAQDALVAASTLAARPDIQRRRIAILGVSHGGAAAARISRDDPSLTSLRQKLAAGGGSIAALVSVYGSCAPDPERPVITPLLILIGSKDDWALPEPCQEFATEGSNASLVRLQVYAGATHSFDNTSLAIPRVGYGHWMAYNQQATADARSRVIEFLNEFLR
jgi:dienelactone hydrolase